MRPGSQVLPQTIQAVETKLRKSKTKEKGLPAIYTLSAFFCPFFVARSKSTLDSQRRVYLWWTVDRVDQARACSQIDVSRAGLWTVTNVSSVYMTWSDGDQVPDAPCSGSLRVSGGEDGDLLVLGLSLGVLLLDRLFLNFLKF